MPVIDIVHTFFADIRRQVVILVYLQNKSYVIMEWRANERTARVSSERARRNRASRIDMRGETK